MTLGGYDSISADAGRCLWDWRITGCIWYLSSGVTGFCLYCCGISNCAPYGACWQGFIFMRLCAGSNRLYTGLCLCRWHYLELASSGRLPQRSNIFNAVVYCCSAMNHLPQLPRTQVFSYHFTSNGAAVPSDAERPVCRYCLWELPRSDGIFNGSWRLCRFASIIFNQLSLGGLAANLLLVPSCWNSTTT